LDISALTPTRQPDVPEPVEHDSYTPAEIEEQQAELERAIQEQESAKVRAKEAKELLAHMIAHVDIPVSEFKSWVFNLYWTTQGYTPILQSLVKKRLGEAHKLWQALIEGATNWPCSKCGQVVQRTFGSKTSFSDAKKYRSSFLCPVCQEEKSQAEEVRTREWRERAEQQSSRLDELKSMPYAEYLQTPEWDATRKAALKRARYRCELCNNQGQLHVHHKTYERLGEEYAKDLITLCADCHAKHHGKETH